jgi:chemotaxis protein CheX
LRLDVLTEAEIRTFVNGATRYFDTAAQQHASIGSPYLVTDGHPGAYDYTGIIGISGTRQGIVYFTAPRGMLTVLLMRMQETDTSEDNIKDLIGEVANTISGNARRDFGKSFVISVPTVLAKDAQALATPHPRSFVIPINWRSHSAKLVVCLE